VEKAGIEEAFLHFSNPLKTLNLKKTKNLQNMQLFPKMVTNLVTVCLTEKLNGRGLN